MTPFRTLWTCATLLSLAACGRSESEEARAPEPQATAETGTSVYAGAGRDRLCLQQGGTVGFITYGEGDSNCSVRGRHDGQAGVIVPEGDESCRIPVTLAGDEVRLGALAPACAYYCGPKASFANRSFRSTSSGTPVTDLAGAPLC